MLSNMSILSDALNESLNEANKVQSNFELELKGLVLSDEKTKEEDLKKIIDVKKNTSYNNERKSGSTLVFPKFEENIVSTKTIIAVTNLSIDIKKLFEYLPVTEYFVVLKKRGRKKKADFVEQNKDIVSGSIITIKLENNLKGVDLKKKQKPNKKKAGKYFRNSLTVVMMIDDKRINFKVSRNGKFQMTGCKSDEQAEKCIQFCWEFIKKYEGDAFTYSRGDHFQVSFIPAMRNIDFDLGFLIDREKLSKFINTMTANYSMLETSFGYTGVNCKVPMKEDLFNLQVKKLEFINNEWVESFESYVEHLEYLTPKEKEKKLTKERYTSFLVFHSGRAISSGMCASLMEKAYYDFLDIIRDCYDQIQEKIMM